MAVLNLEWRKREKGWEGRERK